jgi:hypothetical protein
MSKATLRDRWLHPVRLRRIAQWSVLALCLSAKDSELSFEPDIALESKQ